MQTINIHEAKTHLSRLVDEVSEGKELVIAKAGKPLARLVPIKQPKPIRKPGFLQGRIKIAEDFDAPLPDELLDAFTIHSPHPNPPPQGGRGLKISGG